MNQGDKPSKQASFSHLLKEGWVSLHLDARMEGVVVPGPFASQPHLVLQYGQNMPIPIEDLEVTEGGVTASLSFSRVPHRTFVPWSAVYLITCTNGSGMLFQEDVPADVSLSLVDDDSVPPTPAEPQPRSSSSSASLRALPDMDDQTAEEGLAMMVHSRRRRRPQLRLVK